MSYDIGKGLLGCLSPINRTRVDTSEALGFNKKDIYNQTRNPSGIYLPGHRLVPDRFLMAVRVGGNSKSKVCLLSISGSHILRGYIDYVPLGKLEQDRSSQEDPRLLAHNGKIILAYSGRSGNNVSVCLAEIQYDRDKAIIQKNYYPHYSERLGWEKNWGLFSHDGDLYAVYSISPIHRILKIVDNKAELVYETRTNIPWSWGEMRGGASPVRVGNRYYNWFHSSHGREGDIRLYHTGLYTFDAEPPFAPKELIKEPVLTPTAQGRYPRPAYDVIFPGGAYIRDDKWSIWYGLQETWTEVIEFRHEEVVSLLEPL